MEIFGFELKRKKDDEDVIPSVVSPKNEEGSVVLDTSVAAGGYHQYTLDMDGIIKTESELIRRYREISVYPEVDSAIQDICDESIVVEEDSKVVELVLDELKIADNIKKKFEESFQEILELLEFNTKGHDIFRQWYVDGRLNYHILFADKDIKKGIAELRLIDPQKIKKIKKLFKEKNTAGVEVVKKIEEFYIYNDKGITEQTLQGVRLSKDSVVMCTSGIVEGTTGHVLGYLQKAVKPTNQLKMLEDAVVIYRLARAPERRIFYVDVGSMPKMKAEQYVADMMNKFKNKLVYDAKTGEVNDSKKHLSMMEDFWMPRRDGGKGTEITTLPGGQTLGQLDDVEFFLNKLMRSLNVPVSRTKSESGFNLGRSSEITREEIKFSKFIGRLRTKFSSLFLDLLKTQLVAKGIINLEDWDELRQQIKFKFAKDNYFSELKETEILTNRLQTLQGVDAFIGRYFSQEWAMKNVMKMSDDQIKEMKKQIKEEGPIAPMGAPPPEELTPQPPAPTKKSDDDD